MDDVTDAELRSAGFTPAARNYPLSDAALAVLAAFNGLRVDQCPKAWRYAPNAWCRDDLERRAKGADQGQHTIPNPNR